MLDAWNGCFLIRTLVKCVRTYRLQWLDVSGLDVVMLGVTAFLFVCRPKGIKRWLGAAFGMNVLLEGLCVLAGFQAGSLNGVLGWLQLGGWCGLVLTGGVLVGLLFEVSLRLLTLLRE